MHLLGFIEQLIDSIFCAVVAEEGPQAETCCQMTNCKAITCQFVSTCIYLVLWVKPITIKKSIVVNKRG